MVVQANPPEGRPAIEVEEVTKQYGLLAVLRGVNLRVAEGERLVLFGPNGAGKTTLFNVISGFLSPDTGTVGFNAAELIGLPPHEICRKGVGRTFQLVQPFEDMAVLDNVAAGCLFGRDRASSLQAARARAGRLLESVKLDAKALVLAGSLTLSERKRLEIARALATGPDLLLLDEVMAGLTHAESQEMAALIRKMQGDHGLTVLLIEHNIRLVTGLSHRMSVLNYGTIIAEGEPTEVVRNPEVVKAYLGERRRVEG